MIIWRLIHRTAIARLLFPEAQTCLAAEFGALVRFPGAGWCGTHRTDLFIFPNTVGDILGLVSARSLRLLLMVSVSPYFGCWSQVPREERARIGWLSRSSAGRFRLGIGSQSVGTPAPAPRLTFHGMDRLTAAASGEERKRDCNGGLPTSTADRRIVWYLSAAPSLQSPPPWPRETKGSQGYQTPWQITIGAGARPHFRQWLLYS